MKGDWMYRQFIAAFDQEEVLLIDAWRKGQEGICRRTGLRIDTPADSFLTLSQGIQ
jgi:hypothetical protein